MPKAAAGFRLVVTPTKCAARSVPPWASNQSRAACALAMVSCVVKVLLATMKSVRRASRPRSTASMSCPSTLLTKCTRGPLWASGSSAATAMRGPRSEPPMPMFTTSVMPLRVVSRTSSAKASMASRVACTSSLKGAAPRGARSAVCSTARPSVRFTGSPASIASRRASRPHSRARSSRKCSVAASSRFFDRSAKTSGASKDRASKRAGSRAKTSRRSRPRPWAWKWPCSAAQAAVRSQRGKFMRAGPRSSGPACPRPPRKRGYPRPASRWPWRPRSGPSERPPRPGARPGGRHPARPAGPAHA